MNEKGFRSMLRLFHSPNINKVAERRTKSNLLIRCSEPTRNRKSRCDMDARVNLMRLKE
jgi:hypothetical protein